MISPTRNFVSAGLCLLAMVGTSCTFSLMKNFSSPTSSGTQSKSAVSPATSLPKAKTVFIASLPEPLRPGDSLALSLLDEVTGLALNPLSYPMVSIDEQTYTATLALPYRAVIKYRYQRLGSSAVLEDTARDASIRYRAYFVTGQAEVKDIIGSWSDTSHSYQAGSIEGRIVNADTGTPIPNILLTAAGQRSFSDSSGRFDLHGLVAGTHNLVAYSMDGTYDTFQQGATVASGLTTTVDLAIKAAPLVRMTFIVTAPEDIPGAPIRIAGNLLELGNTFADLGGGLSTVAERMPSMVRQKDGRHSVTLSLPVGAYLQYKYTLGDGFWNAEHTSGGQFRLRELIVPSEDAVVQERVDTWRSGDSSPILFEVAVTAETPDEDLISIQFNPYGWTEPIPMWPTGGDRWAYKLYGPVNALGSLRYRYCRDGQCGAADDLLTSGTAAQGRTVEGSVAGQNIQDTVSDWTWLKNTEPSTLAATDINPRDPEFIAGIEMQPRFLPNWPYYNSRAVQNVIGLGANWIIFDPSWTYGSSSPLELGMKPGQDPFWLDSTVQISQARSAGLNVGIFPFVQFPSSTSEFWSSAPRDLAWWQDWFEHYRAFAVNYADLASQTGSQVLILGGDWLDPAMPNGTLPDGYPTDAPIDSDERWQAVFSEVRQHFSGQVWWAFPYSPGSLLEIPDFVSVADGIYLLWSAPLAAESGVPTSEMATTAGQLLDSEVLPAATALGKPVVLALAYPSAAGVNTGCISNGSGGCLEWPTASQPNNPESVAVDLQAQADAYEAVLIAINSRPDLAGIVSRGYFPPTMLQDKSASVRGKPAAELLWYWFPRLTGLIN